MPAQDIHVEPRGWSWVVRREGDVGPLSEHDDATEATREACERAGREGTALVLVHDRYARVHRVDWRRRHTADGDEPSVGRRAAVPSCSVWGESFSG